MEREEQLRKRVAEMAKSLQHDHGLYGPASTCVKGKSVTESSNVPQPPAEIEVNTDVTIHPKEKRREV